MSGTPLIAFDEVWKTYGEGEARVDALAGINLEVRRGATRDGDSKRVVGPRRRAVGVASLFRPVLRGVELEARVPGRLANDGGDSLPDRQLVRLAPVEEACA